jgi:hypothetical protein
MTKLRRTISEAKRIARGMVKDALKKQGIKMSQVDSHKIDVAAAVLLWKNTKIYTLAARRSR